MAEAIGTDKTREEIISEIRAKMDELIKSIAEQKAVLVLLESFLEVCKTSLKPDKEGGK